MTRQTWFSLEDIALRCEVEVHFVEQLSAAGLLPSCEDRRLPPETTLRVRRIVRLQRDLGVNIEGIAIILDLLDRIEVLERQLARRRP
jgi:DNA-binding transcriptional MerR regulator